jgi:hypothetical protein
LQIRAHPISCAGEGQSFLERSDRLIGASGAFVNARKLLVRACPVRRRRVFREVFEMRNRAPGQLIGRIGIDEFLAQLEIRRRGRSRFFP